MNVMIMMRIQITNKSNQTNYTYIIGKYYFLEISSIEINDAFNKFPDFFVQVFTLS